MFLSLISTVLFLSFLFTRLYSTQSSYSNYYNNFGCSFYYKLLLVFLCFIHYLSWSYTRFIYLCCLSCLEWILWFFNKMFSDIYISYLNLNSFFFFVLNPLTLSWKISVPYTSPSSMLTTTSCIKWIYSKMLTSSILFITLYLLLTLLVVVKITNLLNYPSLLI